MANTSLDLTGLDFNTVKHNFITFLKGQSAYKDYNFTGSNFNVLLDVLSYNTFLGAYYLNQVSSEAFLDTAQLMNSVASHAKLLNYLPRSIRSSSANITVEFQSNTENQPYTIPKGASFSSVLKSDLYSFVIAAPIIVKSGNSTFTFTTDIFEGNYLKDTYIFDATKEFPRFKITNKNADISSIDVTVFEDSSEIGDDYVYSQTVIGLDLNSKVFFIQPTQNGYYELLFGDNLLGRKPKNNSIIMISYRVTKGDLANGCKAFTLNFNPCDPSPQNFEGGDSITVNVESNNGSPPESIDSIKFYAPKNFQTQGRAVTETDYEILLKENFPIINNIACYGGETINPPQYGKVFIALDLIGINGLPDSIIQEFINFIRNKSLMPFDPEFIQPDYLYFRITTNVNYDLNIKNVSSTTIKSLVETGLINYNLQFLDTFKATLRTSKIATFIDSIDPAIVSNQTVIDVYKKLPIYIGISYNYGIISLGFPIKSPSVSGTGYVVRSTSFIDSGNDIVIQDDGNGNLYKVRNDTIFKTIIGKVGIVDYDNGVITLNNILVTTTVNDFIKLFITPRYTDFSSSTNAILTMENEELRVNAIGIRV